jgi:hypothetical protein
MHSQIARPRRLPRRSRAIGFGARARFFRLTLFLTRFLPRGSGTTRAIAGEGRRVAHLVLLQHLHRVLKRGDVTARARKSWRIAFRRAPTEHTE